MHALGAGRHINGRRSSRSAASVVGGQFPPTAGHVGPGTEVAWRRLAPVHCAIAARRPHDGVGLFAGDGSLLFGGADAGGVANDEDREWGRRTDWLQVTPAGPSPRRRGLAPPWHYSMPR
jgi:hypothetical protein